MGGGGVPRQKKELALFFPFFPSFLFFFVHFCSFLFFFSSFFCFFLLFSSFFSYFRFCIELQKCTVPKMSAILVSSVNYDASNYSRVLYNGTDWEVGTMDLQYNMPSEVFILNLTKY